MTAAAIRSRLALATIGCLLAALMLAASAAAKVTHEPEGTFPLSGFSFLTVDNSAGANAGDLYIGEFAFQTSESKVYRASAAGVPTGAEFNGSETPAGSFGLADLANGRITDGPTVDSSAGSNAGDVYVPDVTHEVVDRFDESGHYLCQITGSVIPSGSECAGLTGSATPAGGVEPLSIAVDPLNGDVAVGDARGVVYEFDAAGRYIGEIADSHVTLPGSIAFDSTGSLYVVNESLFTGPGEAVKFGPAGAFLGTIAASRSSLGVDLGNDHVYLGISEGETEEFDPAGNPVSGFGTGALSIAVGRATHRVYTNALFAEGQIWSGDRLAPGVTTGIASAIEETGATVNGSVDPEIAEGGTQVGSCSFEYGLEESYGQSAPCSPSPPYSSATGVSASLTGLAPATTYHYRLIAANGEADGRGKDATFATQGPASISGETAIARTTSATVSAHINPFGYPTGCAVEYVDDEAFRASEFADAATVPCAEALTPSFEVQEASAVLSGLQIGTAYHFRFVATNTAGTTTGEGSLFSTFAIESFSIETLDEEGRPYLQAGGHPYAMKVALALSTTEPVSKRNPASASANVKTVQVELPPGLIGNPTATSTCKPYEVKPALCAPATQVGTAVVSSPRGAEENGPVYNLEAPRGVAAELGARFNAFGTARIDAGVRTGSDYGVDANSIFITADEAVGHIEITLWGVPALESHDFQRQCRGTGAIGCSAGIQPRPFLTDPTSCSGPLPGRVSVDTWQDPGNFVSAGTQMPGFQRCDRLTFEPTISVQPEVRTSESPAGLQVDLHLPQDQNPLGIAEANLKDASVSLPAGLAVNPAAASGLVGCTPAQVELHQPGPPSCPDAAKIGSVELDTPLLGHPLPGAVFLASPHDNPFGSLLAIYIVVDDRRSGVVVKLAGEVRADPETGRLSTTFTENPQLPFEDLKLDFFGGPQAALMTPPTCGRYETTTDMRPWSESGDAHPLDRFEIASGPEGSRCARSLGEAPNAPSFSAGTISPLAGTYSPFVVNLARADGSQRLGALETKLAPGLLASLAGIPYCPQDALVAAAGKSGEEELRSPSCPAASQVGSVEVGVGAGSRPFRTSGKAYLSGPYKGAPLRLAIVTPAVAGPFDLGTVVVRVALYVDPETAQVTARTDPFPTILQGIPLDLRSIALRLDRPRFTLNPTSCKAMSVAGTAFSVLGQAAPLSEHFQVGGCGDLTFAPKLGLRLKGATGRSGHPALEAVVRAKPGEANIGRAQVDLPRSEFLDQGNLNRTCTRPLLLAGDCPRTSVYGKARAWTPLLDRPLEGPVYLVGGYGYRLPALVAELNGQIRVLLVGKVGSARNRGIRNTFEVLPDAPVSRFVLQLKGGKRYGLLENSEDICRKPQRATARFTGQDGAVETARPLIQSSCGKKDGAKKVSRNRQ